MCEVCDTAGVAPLVIVPCDDLNHVSTSNHCRKSVNDRGMGVTTKVHRNKWLIGIIENTLERAGSGLFECIVYGILASFLAHSCHEINDRDGHYWHTQRHAIKAPF